MSFGDYFSHVNDVYQTVPIGTHLYNFPYIETFLKHLCNEH